MAGDARKIGLYGFGAAAHIIAQVAKWEGRSVFSFVRPGDSKSRDFALTLSAEWVGGSDERPPEPLDAAFIFAAVGDLVPQALKSVANLTRRDAIDFLRPAPRVGIVTHTTGYPLRAANRALSDLRNGKFEGAAVLTP